MNILGESILTLAPRDDDKDSLWIERVDETWHQSPLQLFTDHWLPKWRDFVSAWFCPTAEDFPVRVVGRYNGYDLIRVPPMACLQSGLTEEGPRIAEDQFPQPPDFIHPGQFRRSEWYSTVAPQILERSVAKLDLMGEAVTAQKRLYVNPFPTRMGDDIEDMPEPDARIATPKEFEEWVLEKGAHLEHVEYARRPSQLVAVRHIQSINYNTLVLQTAQDIAAKAEEDGFTPLKRWDRPVIWEIHWDMKLGWNAKKEPSIGAGMQVADFIKQTQIGVVIDQSKPLPPHLLERHEY